MGQSSSCICDFAGNAQHGQETEMVTEAFRCLDASKQQVTGLPSLLGAHIPRHEAAKSGFGSGMFKDSPTEKDAVGKDTMQVRETEQIKPNEALRRRIAVRLLEATRNGELAKSLEDFRQEQPKEEVIPLDALEQASSTADEGPKQRRIPSKSAAKAQRKADRLEARNEVRPFLTKNGFATVKSKKTWLWTSYYPLHTAVKQNDVDTIRLLLKARADPQKTNSSGQTPRDLAFRLNKLESHSAILEMLDRSKARKDRKLRLAAETCDSPVKGESHAASSQQKSSSSSQ